MIQTNLPPNLGPGLPLASYFDAMQCLINDFAYIHFGQGNEPRLTISAPIQYSKARITIAGDAYASRYKVYVNGAWRRVWYVYKRENEDSGPYQYSFIRDAKGKEIARVQEYVIPKWVRYPKESEYPKALQWVERNAFWCLDKSAGSAAA